MTNKVTILTVATHEEGYYKLLKKSAANNGFNLITLAFGQKWEGFSMKYRLYKKYLSSSDPEELIVICDAFDVVINGTNEELIERYEKIGKNIICGTENMNPNSGLDVKLITSLCFPYCKNFILNSGVLVGKSKYILDLLNLICEIEGCENGDDQVKLNNICNKEREYFDNNIYVDLNSNIILNGACENFIKYLNHENCELDLRFDKSRGVMVNKDNNNPIFIH